MREYGKVYTAFWTSDDTRSLSEDARTLAIYLLTCPHGNMLGCFRLTDAYAGDDLKWDIERVREGFAELFQKGFAYRCERSFWVFIRLYLKWNQFENPNVGKAAGKMFESISAPSLIKSLLFNALREFSPHFPVAILGHFETISEPFDNPFELSSKTRASARASTSAVAVTRSGDNTHVGQTQPDRIPQSDPIPEIFEYWQKIMDSPKSILDNKRRNAIKRALKTYSPAEICRAIRGCSKSPFHMGDNDRNTKYNGILLILRGAEYTEKFIELDGGRALQANETAEQRQARIIAEFCGEPLPDDENTIEMEDA